jgi:hypothetical protein
MSQAEATPLTVVMVDGSRVAVPRPKPSEMIRWERYARTRGIRVDATDATSFEQLLYLAYSAIHRGNDSAPAFDTWMDQVDEIETAAEEAEAVPPTSPKAPSAA